jgi:hypothetical protein
MLDDLKPIYGPGLSAVITVAVDALYAAIGNSDNKEFSGQFDDLCRAYNLKKAQVIEYSLFWLWMQVKIGAKMFVVS